MSVLRLTSADTERESTSPAYVVNLSQHRRGHHFFLGGLQLTCPEILVQNDKPLSSSCFSSSCVTMLSKASASCGFISFVTLLFKSGESNSSWRVRSPVWPPGCVVMLGDGCSYLATELTGLISKADGGVDWWCPRGWIVVFLLSSRKNLQPVVFSQC